MKAGETWSLYVSISLPALRYTEGTSIGTAVASNAELSILGGAGVGNHPPFGSGDEEYSFYFPRIFNGIIHYETECLTDDSTLVESPPVLDAASSMTTDDVEVNFTELGVSENITSPAPGSTTNGSLAESASTETSSPDAPEVTPSLSVPSLDSPCHSVEISVLFDSDPFGKGWVLEQQQSEESQDSDGAIVQSFFPLDDSLANRWYNTSECLFNGKYAFTFFGRLCCGGGYLLVTDNATIAAGEAIDESEKVFFELPRPAVVS